MSDFSFDEKVKEAQTAESIASHFLRHQPQVVQVDDVRHLTYWRKQDVDFIARMQNHRFVPVEVKSDVHIASSGNVLYEMCSGFSRKGGNRGWALYTAAEKVLVWCPDNNILYSFTTGDMRQALIDYLSLQNHSALVRQSTSNNKTWATINLLIPLTHVPHTQYGFIRGEWVAVYKGDAS